MPLTPPSSYIGPGVAGFMAARVIYIGYRYAKHPQRITEVGLVHLDELEDELGDREVGHLVPGADVVDGQEPWPDRCLGEDGRYVGGQHGVGRAAMVEHVARPAPFR